MRAAHLAWLPCDKANLSATRISAPGNHSSAGRRAGEGHKWMPFVDATEVNVVFARSSQLGDHSYDK